ncbi:uncharacterized protein LOC135493028 [Lineus longissimus]|uniref:uncharacterized protein LOC135493028 n=1 Tax=Lineus longissimus TaxID=88925 RepID=UPI002B4F0AB3
MRSFHLTAKMVFIGKLRRWRRKSFMVAMGTISLIMIFLMVSINSSHQNYRIPNDYDVHYMEVPKNLLDLQAGVKTKQRVYQQSIVRSAVQENGVNHMERQPKSMKSGNPYVDSESYQQNSKLHPELIKALSKFSNLGNKGLKVNPRGLQNFPQKPMVLKTVDITDKTRSPEDANYYENDRDIDKVVLEEDTSDDTDDGYGNKEYANPPFKMSYFENISNYMPTKPDMQFEEVQPKAGTQHSNNQRQVSKYSMGERRHMQIRHITNNKDSDYVKPLNDITKTTDRNKILLQPPNRPNDFKTTIAKNIPRTSVVCNKKGECRTLPLPKKGPSPKLQITESANSAMKSTRTRTKTREIIPNIQTKNRHQALLPKNKLKLSQFLRANYDFDESFDNRGNQTKLKLVTIMEQRMIEKKASRDFSNVTLFSDKQVPIVEDRIYWAREVEKLLPKGITSEEIAKFQSSVRNMHIKQMSQPLWNKCGRPKNQYIVMENGVSMCARYRHPHDNLIQGEVLSFYLARFLGLNNVPIVVMSQVNTSNQAQWQGHDIEKARWEEGRYVALIQWIPDLQLAGSWVKIPTPLLKAYEQHKVLDYRSADLPHLSSQQVMELAQWSDLILYDYITGNYDRVASMQDGADQNKNPKVMHEKIRNLRRSPETSSLWLFDNESGLFDGYELMYPHKPRPSAKKFIDFHKTMLQSICIFRKSTMDNIRRLTTSNSPQETLISFAAQHEPMLHRLRNIHYHRQFMTYFNERLYEVSDWIESCRKR